MLLFVSDFIAFKCIVFYFHLELLGKSPLAQHYH